MELFNDKFRRRTKKFAIDVIKFYGKLRKTDESRIVGKQLLRAATSVAANFRAAARARSDAEFHAKLSITVEETDESQFWLEIMEEAELAASSLIEPLHAEASELVAVFSA